MTIDMLIADCVGRRDLAAALNVCERTVARYEAQPDGLPSIKLGGRKLYRLSSVRQWLESRETRPNPRRKRSS